MQGFIRNKNVVARDRLASPLLCEICGICGFKFGIWIKIKPSGALPFDSRAQTSFHFWGILLDSRPVVLFLLGVYEHDAKNSITTYELSQCCTRRVQGDGRPGVLPEGVR